jgi:hypothetical protein
MIEKLHFDLYALHRPQKNSVKKFTNEALSGEIDDKRQSVDGSIGSLFDKVDA